MAEYIEREAAKRAIMSQYLSRANKTKYADVIDAVPAADVVSMRHGRWFLGGDYEYINCSECLYPFYMGFDTSSDARQYLAREEQWHYCPNCGALMDKDGDGDA